MNLEIIHKYLNSEMTSQEHAAFELRMLKDPTLAEEVALQKDMIAFSNTEIQANKASQTIKEIGEQYRPKLEQKKESDTVPKKSKLIYLIPLSIAALILVGIFIKPLLDSQSMSSEEIYAQYADISTLSFTTRSDENNELLISAQNAFNAKDYPLAIRKFENIIASNTNNIKAIYYQAYAKINSEDIEGGREDLKTLLNNPQFRNSALYQLGLSFIKTDQYAEAIKMFDNISPSSNHYNKARIIIKLIQ